MPNKRYLCCYFGCKVDGPLHRFPKYDHIEKFNAWKNVTDQSTQERGLAYIYNSVRFCYRHFEECYQLPSSRLTLNAVPTLNLSFNNNLQEQDDSTSLEKAPTPPPQATLSPPNSHKAVLSPFASLESLPTISTSQHTVLTPFTSNQKSVRESTKLDIEKHFVGIQSGDTSSLLEQKKICRACLSDVEPLMEFTVYSARMFKYCTSVEVSNNDMLPQLICRTCADMLNKLYNFKQMVVRSDDILKEQCQLQGSQQTASERNEIGAVIKTMPYGDIGMQEHNVPDENINQSKVKRRRRGPEKALTNITRKYQTMWCVNCGKNFRKYKNFEAHIKCHFRKKPDIKYQRCDRTSPAQRCPSDFVRIHTVRRNQCLRCGKNFALLDALVRARRPRNAQIGLDTDLKTGSVKRRDSHPRAEPFSCQLCSKTFKSRFEAKHMTTHTGIQSSISNEPRFICEFCAQLFKTSKALYKHRMLHIQEDIDAGRRTQQRYKESLGL